MRYLTLIFLNLLISPAFAQSPIFHPDCMEEFVAADWDKPFDMKECSSRNPVEGLEKVTRFAKPTYSKSRWQDPEDGGGYAGYVRYTIAAQTKNLVDIEYAFSGGGSGSFYRIFTMGLNDDGTVEMLAFVPFGDRCNDGDAQFEKSYGAGDGQVIISSAATPFRLLNASNRFDWRSAGLVKMMMKRDDQAGAEATLKRLETPKLLNGWSPYEDVDNAAASCAGRVHWKFDETVSEWFPVKVLVEESAFTNRYVSEKKEIKECLSTWVEKYSDQFGPLNKDNMYEVAGPKWLDLVSKVPEVCEEGEGLMGWLKSQY